MNRPATIILSSLLLVLLGVAAGWYAGSHGHAPADAAAPDDQADDPALTPQTLRNLGVETGTATLSQHVVTTAVQAVVVDAPLNVHPVTVPRGGIIETLHARTGMQLAPGAPVVSVLRDAVPLPELRLLGDVVRPISEGLHSAFLELRTATAAETNLTEELARIRAINAGAGEELPTIPRQRSIDLDYQLRAARQRVSNARSELEHHGLSDTQIDAIAEGGHPPPGHAIWRQTLQRHGLWTAPVAALYEALPESVRAVPRTVASLGELSALGLVDDALAAGVKANPAAGNRFAEVASLLLAGHGSAEVLWLARTGALEPRGALRAPDRGPGRDWDVLEVRVRPGERVTAGQTVAVLHDATEMWLELKPAGSELAAVVHAVGQAATLTATPLLQGTGPRLDDLRIERILSDPDGQPGVAVLRCDNRPIAPDDGRRGWQLRPGLRYLVHVPQRVIENCFVLPRDAVTTSGPDRVAYRVDGPRFKETPVHVVYEDADVAVIANDGALFPGDPIATAGALGLRLALQKAAGGHGGHGHSHPH